MDVIERHRDITTGGDKAALRTFLADMVAKEFPHGTEFATVRGFAGVKPLPQRRLTSVQAPAARRPPRMQVGDLARMVGGLHELSALMGVTPAEIFRWGRFIPEAHQAWCRDLVKNWPVLEFMRALRRSGISRWMTSKQLHKSEKTLDNLATEFGITDW